MKIFGQLFSLDDKQFNDDILHILVPDVLDLIDFNIFSYNIDIFDEDSSLKE